MTHSRPAPDLAPATLRLMHDVVVEAMDAARVTALADSPLADHELVAIELAGDAGVHGRQHATLVWTEPVLVDGRLRYRLELLRAAIGVTTADGARRPMDVATRLPSSAVLIRRLRVAIAEVDGSQWAMRYSGPVAEGAIARLDVARGRGLQTVRIDAVRRVPDPSTPYRAMARVLPRDRSLPASVRNEMARLEVMDELTLERRLRLDHRARS